MLHTDSAKAYRQVGPQKWPKPGQLHENFEEHPAFKDMQYVHTNVVHKKKPGVPQQFVARRHVTYADGTQATLLGGTQTVDGYWPDLRAAVGRKGVNTGTEPDSAERLRLHQLIRLHQWQYWHLSVNRFELLGPLYKQAREATA